MILKIIFKFLMVLYLSFILSGCNSQSTQVTQIQKLRILNNGKYPIEDLIVWFPDEKIVFGDVPVGITTEYVNVPNGVYRYAAYEFKLTGEMKTQPVIDWVGEIPMEGTLFTYTIDFDPNRMETREWWVELLEVIVDE